MEITHNHIIKGIPLLKFQSEERIREFQAGKMYMKSLQWYRDYAKKSPSIGDDYEAMLPIKDANLHLTTYDRKEYICRQHIDAELFGTIHSNDYVFCMFGIKRDFEKFSFSDEQKREMISFGDTVLLIRDCREFLRRIEIALVSCDFKINDVRCGFINYYDESVDSARRLCSLVQDLRNVAFQKRKEYAYQQEYRFLIPNNGRKEDFFELQIGDISDISEIFQASALLTSYVINEGNSNE